MKDTFATLYMLVLVSLRNLKSHRVKTLIVGTILVFGSALVLVGTALVDSIEAGMERSITSSISGHLQVYSGTAEDDLALFGGLAFGDQNIGEIRTFADVKRVALSVENVDAIVPQGSSVGMAMTGNEIDEALTMLRRALVDKDEAATQIATARVRHVASLLQSEYLNTLEIVDEGADIAQGLEDLARVLDDAFWDDVKVLPPPVIDEDAIQETAKESHEETGEEAGEEVLEEITPAQRQQTALEFLDTRIAPLAADGRMLFLRYFGTDLEAYRMSFPNFYIERGEMVPPFQRGLLINQRTAERYFKNRVAREFDALRRSIVDDGRTIASSPTMQAQARQMSRQYSRIVLDLGPEDAKVVKAALQEHLGSTEDDLGQLLETFLLVDDTNLLARYELFYEVIGPRIRLYGLDVGDTVTIRTMTRAGYLRAVNVKLYGTFSFRGLETSDLAQTANLLDIVTFRELYGAMTDEQIQELDSIRAEVGIEDIDRASAEDDLFGGSDTLVIDAATTSGFASLGDLEVDSRSQRIEQALAETFTQDAIDAGLSIHAAIILKDTSRLEETRRDLEQAFINNDLNMKVVHWQSASGIVGQFITVIRIVLYIAIGIIFLIALVIINNAMVMATMERTGEIGTMRAIGAPRRFVMIMFIIETLVLGFLAASVGIVLGSIAILLSGHFGLPATTDVMVFLFSGPRLYPTLAVNNILLAIVSIIAVALLSTLYPARIATRIQPVIAMGKKE